MDIVFYKLEDGTSPVKDFIRSLDEKMRAKTVRTVEMLEKNGTALREPYSKSIGDGIFELRIKHQRDKLNYVRDIKAIMSGGIVMTEFEEFKKEILSDPEVKKEYDALGPEYDLIQAMIDARIQQNITQKELSERTGITQADISRIERGTRNPSLAMMKRIAAGLGMQLKLEFIPLPTNKA